jgi:hypothetical protein
LNREPEDGDLLGKELADACFHVLAQSSDANPLSYTELARLLVARGRLSGEPASLAPTVAAAIRAETARGESGRVSRPRFRHVGGGVALTGWYFPREVVHRERDALRAIERYAHELRRGFLRKLGDLPAGGFAELFATWLNSQGVGSLRGVRRPSSSGTEMHFAGVRRRGPEEVRIGIVVLRGSRDQGPAREVGRERVVEMRGTAHHYGGATELWIVTTGQVQSGAHEEASQPASVPVALFDGTALAESMEQARIGLVPVTITVPSIDLDLFDALRGSVEPPARDREPPMREPRGEGRRDERPEAPKAEGDEGESKPEGEPAAGAAAGAAAEERGEGEGGRRRRRRRRRRGGGGEGQPTGAPGAEAAGEDEDEESESTEETASTTAVEAPAPPSDAEDDDEGAAADAEDDE